MKSTCNACLAWSLALLGVLSLGCGGAIKPIEPASPNDFVSQFLCDRLSDSDDASAMSDVIEIRQNTGFIVQFGLEPNPQRPTEFEHRKVAPPPEWPLMVVIYNRNSDDTDSKTLKGCVQPLDRRDRMDRSIEKRSWHLLNSFESAFWGAGARNTRTIPRQPVSPTAIADWKSGKTQWYWSYMCVDKDQSGDFVFEIRLFPTAFWISPARYEMGPHVVLKRGLLRVLPAPEQAAP